jgi:hypothetical protein
MVHSFLNGHSKELMMSNFWIEFFFYKRLSAKKVWNGFPSFNLLSEFVLYLIASSHVKLCIFRNSSSSAKAS